MLLSASVERCFVSLMRMGYIGLLANKQTSKEIPVFLANKDGQKYLKIPANKCCIDGEEHVVKVLQDDAPSINQPSAGKSISIVSGPCLDGRALCRKLKNVLHHHKRSVV